MADTGTPQCKDTFSIKDFLYYMLLSAVPVVAAVAGLWRAAPWLALVFIALLAGALVLAYRIWCPHCPHYGADGDKTRCLFFWNIPAPFPRREGPIPRSTTALLAVIVAAVLLLPVFWLVSQPALLIVYVLSLAAVALTVRRYECPRCTFDGCPLHKDDAADAEPAEETTEDADPEA